jgi:hypothetical protein
MNESIKKFLNQEIQNGRLALAANLLYDIVLVGWIAFAGLYALEALLPTFVIARLSLVKFAVLLLVLSSLLFWLAEKLRPAEVSSKKGLSRPLLIFIGLAGFGVIALTHYRFPWWSIPISLCGYSIIIWLFAKRFKAER